MNDVPTSEAVAAELLIEKGPLTGVVSLILNRPSRKNALTRSLVTTLGDALHSLSQDSSVRVIVLRGAGGAFCSGADLSTIVNAKDEDLEQRISEFHRLVTLITGAPQPVIALVDGPAVGFGADLALCCDMRLFSAEGYLEEGFVKIGLMPDGGGTYFMPRFAGARAFEYLSMGTRLPASQCAHLGIANAVVEHSELEARMELWTSTLAQAAPLAVKQIKQAVRKTERALLHDALANEMLGQTMLLRSDDFQEGVRAFLEKRPPQFSGS